jgi:hypothetical protein
MKVKCVDTCEDPSFTPGKTYDVLSIDADGDIWVFDDSGHEYFFYPEECEIVEN